MTRPPPRLLAAGDRGLVVEFADRIDPRAEVEVRALDAALTRAALPGIDELVPTYRSLLILFDPERLSAAALEASVRDLLGHPHAPPPPRRWTVPACYDPAVAEDIAEAAARLEITPERLAAAHAGATFHVAMYGFAPGYAYLSGCPAELAIPRRATPRGIVPANSLLIAGGQALVAPVPMPTGWYMVARTPARTLDLAAPAPFLFDVGDEIRFEPIDAAAFADLDARAATGEPVIRAATTAGGPSA